MQETTPHTLALLEELLPLRRGRDLLVRPRELITYEHSQ